MDVDRLTRWQEKGRGSGPPPPSPAEVIVDLRNAVGDASDVLSARTFTYLTAWAYIIVAVGSVHNRELLVGTTIQLPVLNAGVDFTTFFLIAPAFLLVLHGYVLLQLYFLARRLHRFDEAARLLPEAEQAHARTLLTPFPFVEWRAGRRAARAMNAIFVLAHWTVYLILPPLLLLSVEFQFLPYQDGRITLFHVTLVIADLLFIWLIWPRLNQGQRGWRAGVRALWSGPVSRWTLAAAPLASLLCVLVSVAFLFDQHPPTLVWLERYVPTAIASSLDFRWSRITVTNATLMKREPAPEIVAQLRSEAGQDKEDEGRRRANLASESVDPLILDHRSLRRAELSGSKLWRRELEEVQLQGARLVGAQLQGANLAGAQLQGAKLAGAQLQNANLDGAQLQGADLTGARLQGADLTGAQLQGAKLAGAQLQGTRLIGARLQGADLVEARLQGADLTGAQLQATILFETRLQGANLYGAGLFLAKMYDSTDLSRADLREVDANPLTLEDQVELKSTVSQAVTDLVLRAKVMTQLAPVLAQKPPAWTPIALPKNKRRDVVTSDSLPDDNPVRRLAGNEGLTSASEEGTYGKALAEELAQVACTVGDTQIASRFVQRMRDLDRGAHLSELAQQLNTRCPGLMATLGTEDREDLVAPAKP